MKNVAPSADTYFVAELVAVVSPASLVTADGDSLKPALLTEPFEFTVFI
jgi:hypothetical protein